VVRRTGETGTFVFVINHTGAEAKVPLAAAGTELLTGTRADARLAVPAGAVRVVRLDD
jgi:beta-galactosidase